MGPIEALVRAAWKHVVYEDGGPLGNDESPALRVLLEDARQLESRAELVRVEKARLLPDRIDAALRAYVKATHSQATAYAGPLAPKQVLCAAREEDLVCCLEPEHEGYAGLMDALVKAVTA